MAAFTEPKITGYRQLNEAESKLMKEAKALSERCGALIEKLRSMPDTRLDRVQSGQPSVDHRWIKVGETQLNDGWMSIIHSISQPTTF